MDGRNGFEPAAGVASGIPDQQTRWDRVNAQGQPQCQSRSGESYYLTHPQREAHTIQQGGLPAYPGFGQIPGRWGPQNR